MESLRTHLKLVCIIMDLWMTGSHLVIYYGMAIILIICGGASVTYGRPAMYVTKVCCQHDVSYEEVQLC